MGGRGHNSTKESICFFNELSERLPQERKEAGPAAGRRRPPAAAGRDQEGKVMGVVAARRQGDAGAGGKVMRAVPVRRSEGKGRRESALVLTPEIRMA